MKEFTGPRAVLVPAVLAALLGTLPPANGDAPVTREYISPSTLATSPDGQRLYVGCATANQLTVLALPAEEVVDRWPLPGAPSGTVVSQQGDCIYVVCSAPVSTVCVMNHEGHIRQRIAVGHTANSPVLSPDGQRLYVCNRFNHDVSVIDLVAGIETHRIRVSREPIAAALTPDGRHLLVANHLYNPATDGPGVAAVVSVINTESLKVIKQLKLARGSGMLNGIAISPDGKYAAVTHLLARYYFPATEVDFGRINSNALSLIDLERMEYLRNVFLDQARRGAANPWGVAWTRDNHQIMVTLAGTHELCLVDAPVRPQKPVAAGTRIPLPGYGPRALIQIGSRVYTANYFSDDLSAWDLHSPTIEARPVELGPSPEPSAPRLGERYFNDATLCHQEWQSCASCHDTDGRMDGLNWDLLNDGMGNPKNAKSLLWAHRTPPAMSLGVRASAEVAVRAGIRHILFSVQPEEIATAMDDYLKSLEPIPSPYLVNGRLSAAAERGLLVFHNPETGCADCHKPPLFTDLESVDVGTRGRYDRPEDPAPFDTPTLVELWRTGPYLHDGSAIVLRDVLVRLNPNDRHGKTSHLTTEQLEDLEAYLLSL